MTISTSTSKHHNLRLNTNPHLSVQHWPQLFHCLVLRILWSWSANELWKLGLGNLLPLTVPLKPELDNIKFLWELQGDDNKKRVGERLSPQNKWFVWHVQNILVHHGEFFPGLAENLGTPDEIWSIPLHKMTQVPCWAIRKIKQSTTDGNIQVINNLHLQGGIGQLSDKGFLVGFDVDMSKWIVLVHRDFLTKERLDSIKESRSIEDTAKWRFQQLHFIPSLFHYKMACDDVHWHTWVTCRWRCNAAMGNISHQKLSSAQFWARLLRPRVWRVWQTWLVRSQALLLQHR